MAGEKKKTVQIFLKDSELIDKLIENSPDSSSTAVEVRKLLESIDEKTALVVFKEPESIEKIKEALGIFKDVFKLEFENDDKFIQSLCDFLITNYKDYEPTVEA